MLDAYYDLSCSPPTYDVIAFLAMVEKERRARGEDEVGVTFLPGPIGGFRDDQLWPATIADRMQMLEHVAMPLCWLLPTVRSVETMTSRHGLPTDGYGIGRQLYALARQAMMSREGIRPLRAGHAEAKRPRRGTVTLREAAHWPERNSRLADWERAIYALADQGWDVWCVRDTKRCHEPLGEVRCCKAAATNIFVRARLYAEATINLFVSNGPAWMAMAMDAPVLMLRPASGRNGSEFIIPRGGQMPGSPPCQRLVWREDTTDEIMRAFSDYVADNVPADMRP